MESRADAPGTDEEHDRFIAWHERKWQAYQLRAREGLTYKQIGQRFDTDSASAGRMVSAVRTFLWRLHYRQSKAMKAD